MSTTPTELLETTAATVEATIAAAEGALAETSPLEALDIDSIKEMMDAFDPASLLPELGDIFSFIPAACGYRNYFFHIQLFNLFSSISMRFSSSTFIRE